MIGPRNFSGRTYGFSPVRPFVCNAFSDKPNFLKFGIQPLWGKSKRMSKPFLILAKLPLPYLK